MMRPPGLCSCTVVEAVDPVGPVLAVIRLSATRRRPGRGARVLGPDLASRSSRSSWYTGWWALLVEDGVLDWRLTGDPVVVGTEPPRRCSQQGEATWTTH